MKECDALKRQLADKDAQVARLRAAQEGGGSGRGSAPTPAPRLADLASGWPSSQRKF